MVNYPFRPNNILDSYKQKEKLQEKFYLTKILKEMQFAVLIMRLSCNNLKRKRKNRRREL